MWYVIEDERNRTAVMNMGVLYLYWKPADSEYGNHNHNHPSHTLLTPATFSGHVTSRRHPAPQT